MMKVNELSSSEKILLAEQLWESVRMDALEMPISDAQKTELDHRLAVYETDGDVGASWNEVKGRILSA